MASIPSNSISQSSPITNPRAPEKPKEGYWKIVADLGNAVTQAPKALAAYGKFWIKKGESPKEALEAISATAERGLQRAAVRGLAIDPEAGQRVLNASPFNADETPDPSTVGLRADISPTFASDPEMTRALDLQARVNDPEYWKRKMAENADNLVRKASAFATLEQMCGRCGISTKDKLPIMKMVKKFTEEGNSGKTLWKLFTEHYSLTFFQKMKAGWFYCLYYLTSLIPNTVRAYVEDTIKNLTKDLIDEKSTTRHLVFRKTVQNFNQFLEDDIRATKDFAFQKERGDLNTIRERAIKRHYNPTLASDAKEEDDKALLELCKAFTKKRLNEGEERTAVPILPSLQKIPLIGFFFKAFETFVNRFVIRPAMKSSLPDVIKASVDNAIEATAPHNLSFKINFTLFLIKRLEVLNSILDSGTLSSSNESKPLYKLEMLDPVAKNLVLELKLFPAKTALDLRTKFTKIENPKLSDWLTKEIIDKFIEQKVEKAIEQGTVDGGNLLFEHLDKTSQTRELFATLSELSCAAFSPKDKSEQELRDEFDAEKERLLALSKAVGQKIVKDAIAKTFNGADPDEAHQLAQKSFHSGKMTVNTAFSALKNLSERMGQKINQSAQAPSAENNIQQEIVEFLQIMKAFADRKEVQLPAEKLSNKLDRDGIWRLMTPLYQKAAQIENRILTLQELQDHYPSHTIVIEKLEAIKSLFTSFPQDFHALQIHCIQTLGKYAEEISQCLGSKAKVTTITQKYIQDIDTYSKDVVKGQKVIEAIVKLYPPRLEREEVDREGYLEEMLNYQRGIHPRGFKPSEWREKIDDNLKHFPDAERRALETLIGNGSNLRANWSQIGTILQRVYQQHMELKTRSETRLDEVLRGATQWTQDKINKYRVVKDKDHADMQKEIRFISAELNSLQNEARNIQLDSPAPSSERNVGGALYSTAAGVVGGAVGLWFGMPAAFAAAGAAIPAIKQGWSAQASTSQNKGVKAVAGTLGMVAAYAFGGPYWTALGAAGTTLLSSQGARQLKEWSQSFVQSRTEKKVLQIFEDAYEKFSGDDLIYRAGATRMLKELS